MTLFSKQLDDRRSRNAKALSAFGVSPTDAVEMPKRFRTVRQGKGPTLYTVGYERRTGEELIDLLRDAGVEVLVDVRERAMSRRADFRGAALRARCEASGIDYLAMPGLGSTPAQRDELKASGDLPAFHAAFRRHSEQHQGEALRQLAGIVIERPAALICYEREHEDCHRSVLADLVADELDATVVALT